MQIAGICRESLAERQTTSDHCPSANRRRRGRDSAACVRVRWILRTAMGALIATGEPDMEKISWGHVMGLGIARLSGGRFWRVVKADVAKYSTVP